MASVIMARVTIMASTTIMTSVTNGKCYLWQVRLWQMHFLQKYYGKCNHYDKCNLWQVKFLASVIMAIFVLQKYYGKCN